MSALEPIRRNVTPLHAVTRMPSGGIFEGLPCSVTTAGLIIERGTTIEEWVEIGKRLRRAGDAVQICLGDWIRHGKHAYGKKYHDAVKLTGYTEQSLTDNVWVAKAVPFSSRDEKLKFKHYRVVAPLSTLRQRAKWLRLALKGDKGKTWPAAKLKREIDKAKHPPTPAGIAPALKTIQEQAVRQELDAKIAEVRAWIVATVDPRLTILYSRLIESLEWQRDRTERGDCDAIMQIFTGDEGTEGTERATDGDIPAWLYGHGFIMTKEEIGQGGCPPRCSIEHKHLEKSGRLGLMVRLKMLSVETREGSRHEDQPGAITSVYKAELDYLTFLVDDVPDLEAPDREPALQKDWDDRLKRYAPERLPKSDKEVCPMK